MKALLWILGIPAALLVIAVISIPLLVDEKAVIEMVANRLEANSGIVLKVDGDAALSLFPKASISTSSVSIDIPDSGTRVTARSLAAGVALLPLLRNSVEIDSVMVDGLTLTTPAEDEAAAKAAALDTSTLSRSELDAFYRTRTEARQRARSDAAAQALAMPMSLEVGEVVLTDIRVVTVDSANEPISELVLKQLSLRGLNVEGRSIPLSATILIPAGDGGEDMEISLAKEGEFRNDLSKSATTLDRLDIKITGATAEPLIINAKGTFYLNQQLADLQVHLATGDLEGEGTVRYSAFESPQIDADLDLTELNPALLFLAGPEAGGSAAATSTETGEDTPLPLHALRMIDTRARLNIDTVVLDAHRLENVSAALRAVDGVITLEPVAATVHGGAINFITVLDAHYNEARLISSGGVKALDIGRAAAAAEIPVDAAGSASLEWQIEGTGTSIQTLTGSLAGPISFTTTDITLKDIALQKMLCQGVALVNQESLTAQFPTDTTFDDLSAQIQLSEGIARLDPLNAQLPAIALTGNGTLNLSSQDLAASLRAQLSPELGDFDPACTINERYTELRWPMECKGNLAGDPADWCGVSTSEIIKDLAEAEAQRKVQKEAGKLLKKILQ